MLLRSPIPTPQFVEMSSLRIGNSCLHQNRMSDARFYTAKAERTRPDKALYTSIYGWYHEFKK
jgi:hypothetical protein